MYWREIYPTHRAAFQAERLGDLGKVKLDATQKAAIRAAKADAKIQATKLRANEKAAKITRKTAIRDAVAQTKIARQLAKQGKYQTNVAIAQSDIQALQTPQFSESGSAAIPFAQSGGGGGGSSPIPYEAAPEAASADAFGGIPMPALLIGGVLLLVIVMKR